MPLLICYLLEDTCEDETHLAEMFATSFSSACLSDYKITFICEKIYLSWALW